MKSTATTLPEMVGLMSFTRGRKSVSVIPNFKGEFAWLSNFEPCTITLPTEGDCPAMTFGTLENAYMAAKVLDFATRQKLQTISPGEAKDLSRTPAFIALHRPEYSDAWRLATMKELLLQKFSTQNPELLYKLLQYEGVTIIEGNLHQDTFFGVDMKKGFGLNHLGRLIMEVLQIRLAERT